MNVKLYKLKFDKLRGEYVAVSEITSLQSSGVGGAQMTDGSIALEAQLKPVVRSVLNSIASSLTHIASFGVVVGTLGLTGLSAATVATAADVLPNLLPTGGQIVAGQGAIQNTSSNVLTVQQDSQKLITNWQSFNVGAGHTVIFNQPNSSSVALNRVLGNSRSDIAGTIQSNGQVYLLNPNGVLFSSTSQVNVGSLVAGTHSISNADFMNGRLNFTNGGAGGSISGADVVNEGRLTVAEGGHVVLMGESVKNNGTITANGGQVVLSAGDKISLAESGSNSSGGNLLSVTVTEASIRALVENKGLIVTNGGQVYLTAHGRDMLSTTVVNNTGVIRANSLGVVNGEIVLDGGESGAVVNSGTLDASGLNAGETGGTVKMAGQYVGLLDSGKIDARGDAGGGKVLVGGDYQGKDSADYQNADGTTLRKADVVLLNRQAVIDASAVNAGKGGKVILWSDKYTNFEGNILAKGGVGVAGQTGGDGGFVETSSKENLQAFGRVDARGGGEGTGKGKVGQWLLDPTDVTISTASNAGGTNTGGTWSFGSANSATINNATIESSLNAGTSVTITTSSSGTATGHINVNASINKTTGGAANLNLAANGSIAVNNANITSTSGALFLNAGGTITLNVASLSTNGGNIVMQANSTTAKTTFTNSTITTGNGNLTVNASALSMLYNNTINVGSGTGLLTGTNAGSSFHALEFVLGTTLTTGAVTFKGTSSHSVYRAVDMYSNDISSTDNRLNIIANYTGSTAGYLAFRINGDAVPIYSSLNNVSLTALGGGGLGLTTTRLNVSGNVNITSLNGISSSSVWGSASGQSVNLTLNTGSNAVSLTNSANAINGTVSIGNASSVSLSNTLGFSLGTVSATGDIAVSSNQSLTLNGNIQSTGGNVTLTAGSGVAVNAAQLNGSVTGGDVIKGTATSISAGGSGKTVTIFSGNADTANLSSLVTNGGTSQRKVYSTISTGGTPNATKALNLFYRVAPNLTISASNVTRLYNGIASIGGDLGSSIFSSSTGLIDGDVISGSPTIAAIAGGPALVSGGARNAGNYLIDVSALTAPVTGYNLTARSNATFAITKVNVTVGGITAQNKVYDGATNATLNTSAAVLSGKIFGDNLVLDLSLATGAFADKNAAMNKAVTVNSASLTGSDAGNYQFLASASGLNALATISKADISAISGITATDRVYDSSVSVTINTSAAILTGKVSGDVLNVSGTANFLDKNVANAKTVNVNNLVLSGSDVANYQLTTSSATTTANITKANITAVSGITAQNKVYDGTTNATLNTALVTLTGRASGDSLTLSGTGTFANKNVANAKVVTVSNATLGGADAGNYQISSGATGLSASADISQASITSITGITALDKVYDGAANATVNTSAAVLIGKVVGDSLSISASGQFGNTNAGANKTVLLTNVTLSGTDVNNYLLTGSAVDPLANITQANITAVTGITAQNKVYDGSASAIIDTSAATLTGKVASDILSVSGTGTFANKNVGINKVVTVNNLTLSGAAASNYRFTTSSASTTANISKANITAVTGITASDKVYDGTSNAAVSLAAATLTGKVSGDALSVSGTATFADKNVGLNKAVTINSLALAGGDAGNYQLIPTVASTSATITQANVNVNVFVSGQLQKEYDGSTAIASGATVNLGGLISSDTWNSGSAAVFTDKNAGIGNKTITVTGLSISDGNSGGNYNIVLNNATGHTINKKTLAFSNLTVNSRIYDGTTSATLGSNVSGVASGDQISVAFASLQFATKDAGINKAVAVTSGTITGTDSANYQLAQTSGNLIGNITPKSLTISGLTADSKSYDGTRNASVSNTGVTYTGLVSGDSISVNTGALSAVFADKNVGNGKTVSVNGISITGRDQANYQLSGNTAVSLSANINQANLTLTTDAMTKVYDGTTSASGVLKVAASGGTVFAGDTINTAAVLSFVDKNVGTSKQATVNTTTAINDGNAGANYLVSFVSNASKAVTRAPITIHAISATDKTYDATTTANVSGTFEGGASPLSVNGVADNVSLALVGTFSDKNAGQTKVVTLNSATLAGSDAGNYQISALSSPLTTVANISRAEVTYTPSSTTKVYDGTRLTNAGSVTGNPQGSDIFEVSFAPSFLTADVGSQKVITMGLGSSKQVRNSNGTLESFTLVNTTSAIDPVSNLSLSTEKYQTTNYNLTVNSNVGAITPLNISITNVTAAAKVYDATTSVNITTVFSSNLAASGLTLSGVSFSSANVGNNVSLTGNQLVLSGSNAGNFNLLTTNMSALSAGSVIGANITPATISYSGLSINSKVYDGTQNATLQLSGVALTGVKGSDSVALTTNNVAAVFDSADAGDRAVSVTGIGLNNANYVLATGTSNPVLPGQITKRNIVVAVGDLTKVYDGTADASASFSLANTTFALAQNISSISYQFDNKNAGAGKTLTASNITVSDSGNRDQSSNYQITVQNSTQSAILRANLNVSVADLTKEYDGSLSATGVVIQAIGGTQLYGNDQFADGVFRYTDKNVGTGKTITVSNVSVSDPNDVNSGGNYNITFSNNVNSAISAKNVTVIASGNLTKTYDGTNTSSATVVSLANGFIAGDSITANSATAAYSDKNAGTGKTILVTGTKIQDASGTDVSSNYRINAIANNEGVIEKVVLSASGSVQKFYDGTTNFSSSALGSSTNVSLAGVLAADQGNVRVGELNGVFDTAAPGTGKLLQFTSGTLGGSAAMNYLLSRAQLSGSIVDNQGQIETIINQVVNLRGDYSVKPLSIQLIIPINFDFRLRLSTLPKRDNETPLLGIPTLQAPLLKKTNPIPKKGQDKPLAAASLV